MADEARQLLERLRALKKQQKPPTVTRGVAQGMAEGLVGNLLGIPEFFARAGRGGGNVLRAATGNEMIPIPPEGLLGLPTGREALAGVKAGVGGLLGIGGDVGDFGPRFQSALAERNQIQEQRPISVGVGGLVADAATLASGRAPLVKGPGGLFDKPVAEAVGDFGKFLERKAGPTGTRRFMTDIVKSSGFKTISRAFGRSAETGVEGTVLAVLQNGDPVETAALAMGGQLVASGSLSLAQGVVELPFEALGTRPKGFKGMAAALAINAAIAGGLWQLFKSLTPGGRDRILESDEAGFQKVAGALLLGMTAGLLGKRSKPEGLLSAFPKLADAAAAAPRAALLSIFTDLTKDETGLGEKTLNTIQKNPTAFNEKQIKTLEEGLKDGTFVSRVKKLIEMDEDFAKKLDAPDPRLADVPEK